MTLIDTPKYEEHNLDLHAKEHITVVRKCVLCGGETKLNLSFDKWKQWRAGTHIQDVWPKLNVDLRETLISGSHGSCFDEVFKDED